MALESTVNYIEDLNEVWPIGNVDTLDEADNHLRIIKTATKGSFPNLGQAAVTLTAAEINALSTAAADIVANALGIIPVGGIIMYNGTFSAIPANYQLCDGTNGTPDMTNQFAYGTNTEVELEDAGGSANAINVSHTHTFSGNAVSNHNHVGGIRYANNIDPDEYGQIAGTTGLRADFGEISASTRLANTSSNGGHTPSGTNSTVGSSATDANIPPYIKLAYIRRMT